MHAYMQTTCVHFPPTDVPTPVCVPLQRRGGADGVGRSAPPAVQTEADREAATAEIQEQIEAIDRRLDGPMSADQGAAARAKRAALCAQLQRILDAPTVRIPARCRSGRARSHRACACMYDTMYRCVLVCTRVCTLWIYMHILAQTDTRTYIRTRARTRAQAPSFRPLTAQPAPAEAVRGVRWQVGDSDDGDDGYDTTGTNDEDVQFNQADQVSVTAAASLPNGRRSRPRSTVPARRSAPPPLCHLGGQRAFPAGGSVGPRHDRSCSHRDRPPRVAVGPRPRHQRSAAKP